MTVHGPKFIWGCSLGFKFNQHFRAEAEYTFRQSLVSYEDFNERATTYSTMANLYLDRKRQMKSNCQLMRRLI